MLTDNTVSMRAHNRRLNESSIFTQVEDGDNKDYSRESIQHPSSALNDLSHLLHSSSMNSGSQERQFGADGQSVSSESSFMCTPNILCAEEEEAIKAASSTVFDRPSEEPEDPSYNRAPTSFSYTFTVKPSLQFVIEW
jgi:hypothetical protein